MKEIDLKIKVTDYIEGNMSEDDKQKFEIFLSEDKELMREVQELKLMLSNIKKIEELKLDTTFDERLRRSIDNYDNKKTRFFNVFNLFDNPNYASIGAVAAMVLLVVTTFVLKPYGNTNSKDMLIKYDSEQIVIDELAEDDLIDSEFENYDDSKDYNKKVRVYNSRDSIK